jgi:hypothetical protein
MRAVGLSVLIGLLMTAAGGCGGNKKGGAPGAGGWGGRTERTQASTESDSRERAPAMKSREAPAGEALVAAAPPVARAAVASARHGASEPQSGILTAASFDDTLHPDAFRRFLRNMSQNDAVPGLPGRLSGRLLVVTVRGKGGQPLGNTRVRLSGPSRQGGVELVTRSDGRVVFLSSWDGVDGDRTLTVTPPDGSAPVRQAVPRGADQCEVSLAAVPAPLPKNLDLLLVLDTTGSMADELAFLTSEARSIASAIHARFPQVNQRYGLILYRDRGDEYVVRTFDFTPSVDRFRDLLAAQQAAGGGDIPESMHRGLEEAAKLRWRGADTARVLFLVADAPPHSHEVAPAMAAADTLRKMGVAIYPVACSGYDDATELVMRSCALLTGGKFLFLTDDSGVGEAHGEPHIPFYQVQRLDRLLVRMVAGELAGRHLDPLPDEILRTVGNPPRTNGQH